MALRPGDGGGNPFLAAALAYAERGWAVFPIQPRGKLPAISREQGGRGLDDATRDPEKIRAWWAQMPRANIGVATGVVSGFWVLDVDTAGDGHKHDGNLTLDALELEHGALPATVRQRTPSGGRHFLFRCGETEIRNSASRVGAGLDTRGDGGYIVVPPSTRDGGKFYAWNDGGGPDEIELAEAPAWLIALYVETRKKPAAGTPAIEPAARSLADAEAKYVEKALAAELSELSRAGQGGRNDALNRAAFNLGQLVGAGYLSRGRVELLLRSTALGIGLEPRETDATIGSGLTDGMAKPRELPKLHERTRQAPATSARLRPEPAYDRETGEVLEHADNWQRDDPGPAPRPSSNRGEISTDPGLPLLWFADVEPSLEVLDFVEETLTEGGMSVVYGPSNCGKTFFAMDLGLHVALGRRWFNRDVDQGGVVYVVAEGGHGAKNRVTAFRRHHGLDDATVHFAMIVCPINLLDPRADRDRLIDAVQRAAATIETRVSLIVVDTLSRALAGGNENAPEDMGALVTNADAVRHATGAHLMFVHHTGKDEAKGARGHSLLRAAIDTEIEIERDDVSKIATATATKQRDLETGSNVTFKLKVVELGENRRGKPVTSCVVELAKAPELPFAEMRLKPKEERALRELRLCIEQHGQDGVRPNGSLFTVRAVERDLLRRWWVTKGVIEVEAPGQALSNTDRSRLNRLVESLGEKRRLAVQGNWIWTL